MVLFPKSDVKRYRDYFVITAVGIMLALLRKGSIPEFVGVMFLMFFIVDVFMVIVGLTFGKVFLQEITNPVLSEKKHSDGRHYQYIVKHRGREVWSYVYTRPLEDVNVRVFVRGGRYWFLVKCK